MTLNTAEHSADQTSEPAADPGLEGAPPSAASTAASSAAQSAAQARTEHRHRLLEGMATAVAKRGYADTTIADIVREAAVSRRTFYEHFATKADCLVALYEASSHNALKVLRGAVQPAQPWATQVERALGAYFAVLGQSPALLRSLFIDILGLGAPGLAARRRVNDAIADLMLEVINGPQPDGQMASLRLTNDMALAVVGGINELILSAIETDRAGDLHTFVAPASELVRAVALSRAGPG